MVWILPIALQATSAQTLQSWLWEKTRKEVCFRGQWPSLAILSLYTVPIVPVVQDCVVLAAVAECKRVGALVGLVASADIARITSLSSAFRTIENVGKAYCGAISNVCRQPESAGRSNRLSCGAAVLEEVIAVLTQHEGNASILPSGLMALYNSMLSHSTLQSAAIRLGVVPLVLATMTHFPSNFLVQRSACWLLSLLVVIPVGKTAIVAGDGVRLLRAARAAHLDEGVQERSKVILQAIGEAP